MESFEQKEPIYYDKWGKAVSDRDIYGPVYYFADRVWYLDTRVREDTRAVNVYDLGDAAPDYRWRVQIPGEVVQRFGLKTPPEPPYFIH